MTPATLNLKLIRGSTFGAVVITCKDSADAAVDLTDWLPFAQVRTASGGTEILDLAPTVTDAAGGEVTIPQIEDEDTLLLEAGDYFWDFILQNPTGSILGPYIAGRFNVRNKITKP